jgi:PAS domain S-box-containing protein
MKKMDLKAKSKHTAVLQSLPDKENPLYEIIRLLTEESDTIVYIHDGKLNFSYLSPGIFTVTGYTPEEWKQKSPSMITANPINKEAAGFTQKAIQTGQKIPPFQLEIHHKEGHSILLEINETPYLQEGRVVGVIGIARDISEKKKLLRFVENFQSFLKAIPIPLVIYTPEGLVSYLNPAFEKTFGWNAAELEGRKIPFVPDEEQPSTLEHIQKVLSGEEVANFETKRFTKAGDLLEISLTSFPYNDEQGNQSGIVVMLRDVTKRRTLERELNRRLSFEEKLIESTMDGILAVDRQGFVILYNQGAARIFGYDPQSIVGKIHATQLYPETVAHQVKKAMWSSDYGGKGKLIDYETEIVNTKGQTVSIRLSGSILFDGEEEIGSVGYFHDLTYRKNIEEAIRGER